MTSNQNIDGIHPARERTAKGSASVARGQPVSNGAGPQAINKRDSQVFYERPGRLDGLGPRLQRVHPATSRPHQAPGRPKTKKPRRGKITLLTIIGILTTVALLIGGGFGLRAVYSASLEPVAGRRTEPKLIHIEDGMSSAAAANLLAEQDLIRSALAMRWHLRLNGISSRIQAGVYQLDLALSTPEIAKIITSGETVTHSITIISGSRLRDIADKIGELGFSEEDIRRALNAELSYSILKDKPPTASLEGYLFPDTYHIDVNSDVGTLIDLILANLESKTPRDLRQAWAKQGLNTYQALTLASIVQKEVSDPVDQRRVAQVFLKRLNIGMALEADPTFEYGAFLRGVPATPEVNSPYNTYKHKGLPPGPISSVGESAMAAVANPADTDYLYFVSAPDGTTYFSHTKTQHEANIERYLR